MSNKDINIHIGTPGAKQSKQNLDSVGRAAKGVGDKTASGQKQVASSTEKANRKLDKQKSSFDGLKGKLLGYIAAGIGIERLIAMFGKLLEKLQAIQKVQSELYEKSLPDLALGQALEFQTGTVGAQQQWTKHILELQKAGGLTSPEAAEQMMVSGDIAFGAHGGVKNQKIKTLLKELAPMIGSAGLSGEEVSKFFEFAGTAGVDADAESYKGFFAKLQQGFTSSKATSFGSFITGLQKGATPYLNYGGSLDEAISGYTAARSVTANESLAATAQEQLSRLAAGSNARFTGAVQDKLGINFAQMPQDARQAAVLKYVASIPQSQRAALLVEAGVPQEVVGVLSSLTGREATAALTSTREKVSSANAADTDASTNAWTRSPVATARSAQAERDLMTLKAGPGYAAWSERVKTAQESHKILAAKGKDALTIPDAWEPKIMALESLMEEYRDFYRAADDDTKEDFYPVLEDYYKKVKHSRDRMMMPAGGALGLFDRIGQKGSEDLNTFRKAATIHNDYSQHFYPAVGADSRGPRVPTNIR
jgi:hypothetical protein